MTRTLFHSAAALCACCAFAACAAQSNALPSQPLALDTASYTAPHGPRIDADAELALPDPAQAAAGAPSALAGLYFFAGGGATQFDAGYSGDVDDSDSALDVGLGYGLHQFLAVEAGYTDLGETHFTSADGLTTGSTEVDGFQLAAVGRYPLGSRFQAQARLGAFFWNADSKLREDEGKGGITDTSDDDSGIDLLYGLGVQADIGAHFGARVEWRRMADAGGGDIDALLLQLIYSL